MKTFIKQLLLLTSTLCASYVYSQTINWGSLNPENKHLLYANAGMEYGVVYGLGYAHQFKMGSIPVLAHIEYSFPSGSDLTDDFKAKTGIQAQILKAKNLRMTARIDGIFRRYENDFARLLNFGSEVAGTAGYYRKGWFAAAEVGFDKAIVTHFKHSDQYREIYPAAVNGWFVPPTGGNFFYGLQAGCSFGKHDITVKAGKFITQDFKTTPTFPLYGQLGYTLKF